MQAVFRGGVNLVQIGWEFGIFLFCEFMQVIDFKSIRGTFVEIVFIMFYKLLFLKYFFLIF